MQPATQWLPVGKRPQYLKVADSSGDRPFDDIAGVVAKQRSSVHSCSSVSSLVRSAELNCRRPSTDSSIR